MPQVEQPYRCGRCQATYPAAMRLRSCPLDGSPLISTDNDPFLGLVIDGRYRVIRYVDAGSGGAVYYAEDQQDGTPKAIKVLHDHLVPSEIQMKRFKREAAALKSMEHPHILQVFSHGLMPRGQPFIVMDWLKGRSLYEILEKEGRLPVKRAVAVALQVCDALAYAHARGIIHRDIKPANIYVNDDGVKVIDFGLAKFEGTSSGSASLTGTGQTVGTPLYMSPEQCLGKELDSRSDVYSLGCVLYEALTGKPPFASDSQLAAMQMHLSEQARSFGEVREDLLIPAGVEAVVFRAMAKDPPGRYQSMKMFRDSLEAGRDLSIPETRGRRLSMPLLLATSGVVASLALGAIAFYLVNRTGDAGKVEVQSAQVKRQAAAPEVSLPVVTMRGVKTVEQNVPPGLTPVETLVLKPKLMPIPELVPTPARKKPARERMIQPIQGEYLAERTALYRRIVVAEKRDLTEVQKRRINRAKVMLWRFNYWFVNKEDDQIKRIPAEITKINKDLDRVLKASTAR